MIRTRLLCWAERGGTGLGSAGWARLSLVRLGWVGMGSVRFGSIRFGSVRSGPVRFGSIGLGWVELGWVGRGWGQIKLGGAARKWAEQGWTGHVWVGLLRGIDAVLLIFRPLLPPDVLDFGSCWVVLGGAGLELGSGWVGRRGAGRNGAGLGKAGLGVAGTWLVITGLGSFVGPVLCPLIFRHFPLMYVSEDVSIVACKEGGLTHTSGSNCVPSFFRVYLGPIVPLIVPIMLLVSDFEGRPKIRGNKISK